jgi:hypothetical protein
MKDLITLPLEDRLYIIEQVLTSSNYADYLNYLHELLEKEGVSGDQEQEIKTSCPKLLESGSFGLD